MCTYGGSLLNQNGHRAQKTHPEDDWASTWLGSRSLNPQLGPAGPGPVFPSRPPASEVRVGAPFSRRPPRRRTCRAPRTPTLETGVPEGPGCDNPYKGAAMLPDGHSAALGSTLCGGTRESRGAGTAEQGETCRGSGSRVHQQPGPGIPLIPRGSPARSPSHRGRKDGSAPGTPAASRREEGRSWGQEEGSIPAQPLSAALSPESRHRPHARPLSREQPTSEHREPVRALDRGTRRAARRSPTQPPPPSPPLPPL